MISVINLQWGWQDSSFWDAFGMDGIMTGAQRGVSDCSYLNVLWPVTVPLAESAMKSQLKAFPLLLERVGHFTIPFSLGFYSILAIRTWEQVNNGAAKEKKMCSCCLAIALSTLQISFC